MGLPAGDWIISRIATSFLFVPVNVMAFGHVPRDKTNQASGLINLSRNIGGSMGISFVTTVLYSRAAHHLGVLGGTASAAASLARGTALAGAVSQAAGKVQLFVYQGLERQAMALSFVDSFRILAAVALIVLPLLLLLKRGKPSAAPAHVAESAA
jgi:DHA2 family multidrug resistance protein